MEDRKMTRRGFVALTGAASLGTLLAACGGGGSEPATTAEAGGGTTEAPPATTEAPPATTEAPPATTEAAAGPTFDPATEPDGPIEFFEWVGYDDTSPWMWQTYLDSEYNAKSPLKFTFLDNDIQALAKVASGYSPDAIHPCIAYWPDFNSAGLIQPFDLSLLPDYEGIPEAVRIGGVDSATGLTYHVPFDIGFSSLVYRADKIPLDPGAETWSIFLDEAYAGRMAMYSDPVTIIKIGALINEGAIDPNKLNSDQIAAAKETMTKARPNIRNFWSNSQENIDDFINGNIWATYMWPDGFIQASRHEKMKDVEVRYMWPTEGRLGWVCGFVLGAHSERPGRTSLAIAAANTPAASAALTDNWYYLGAQQNGTDALIQDQTLIPLLSLDDPSAFEPPRTWFEEPLPNRQEYSEAGEAVKAA
ncbi:MAG: extracellular solute-binding protein [Gaiellales bacterium]